MSQPPDIDEVRQLKRSRGRELMERYGAHAVGVGRSEAGTGEGGEPALLFYVEHRAGAAAHIPPTLTFRPGGGSREVTVRTRIVEAPPARLEEE